MKTWQVNTLTKPPQTEAKSHHWFVQMSIVLSPINLQPLEMQNCASELLNMGIVALEMASLNGKQARQPRIHFSPISAIHTSADFVCAFFSLFGSMI